ncbi:MAG: DUF4189 domain-containing protein [Pseudomonadota bacterium]
MAILTSLPLIMAFVVEGPRWGATDARTNLEQAPRWGPTQGSLVERGERGLGGGLEYAIDESICELNFIDGSTCGTVKDILTEALGRWSSGHPAINFVDVSDDIEPAFPLSATGEAGQGAEIDFFATRGRFFPPFLNPATAGYTIFYEGETKPMALTNGTTLPQTSWIQSADVRFSAERCYYIESGQGRPDCIHFPSLALHEIGHALGIGHPDERPHLNLDSDDDAGNRLNVDCREPLRGLFASGQFSGAAVMVGQDVHGPGRWRRGLSYSDIAARDALYPHCGIETKSRFTRQWGAYAKASNGLEGRARFLSTRAEADGAALAQCQRSGGQDCSLIAGFDGCFAYAIDPSGKSGFSVNPRSSNARYQALESCQTNGQACEIIADFCAFE